jgi:hypothetical protein
MKAWNVLVISASSRLSVVKVSAFQAGAEMASDRTPPLTQ